MAAYSFKVKGVAKKVTDLIRIYGDDRDIEKGTSSSSCHCTTLTMPLAS